VIVGLGKTGYSCARFLTRKGIAFSVVDDVINASVLESFHKEMPDISLEPLSSEILNNAEEIILSPGVPLKSRLVQDAVRHGVPVTGDIAIFSEETDKPLAVITGSNGKSTVTDLVGFLARRSGVKIGIGGNIGIPCLDILDQGHDVVVLEVSSYQLEVIDELKCKVASVLNLSPDHLDRYSSVADYYETKAQVYQHCDIAIVNREANFPMTIPANAEQISFGFDRPSDGNFGISYSAGHSFLCKGHLDGCTNLLDTRLLKIRGRHNWLNALAALAIGQALGFKENLMVDSLQHYVGLPHRCEWIGTFERASFYNDSKSTNPGSTFAAIEGFASSENNVVVVLGGVAKDADFRELGELCRDKAKKCLVFGQDRDYINQAINQQGVLFETLADVMQCLKAEVLPGDLVLFSPACASFDQYENFEQRGEHFKRLVRERFA